METKYTFRNELKCGSLEQIVREWLEMHGLMNVDNLCCKTGFPESDIRSTLEVMLARGEIERLRPLEYKGDNMDFFRLKGPLRPPITRTGNRWFSGLKRAARLFFDDPEDNIEHHHLNNILTSV